MGKFTQAKTRQLHALCLCSLALIYTALSSGGPLAFSITGSAPTQSSAEYPASDDPLFKGPAFLKVLLHPQEDHAFMDNTLKDRIPLKRDLEQDTDTRIQMPLKGDWYPDPAGHFSKVLRISGEAAGVLEAFSRVRPNHDRDMVLRFLVPSSAVEVLKGKDACALKAAEQQTGTSISVRGDSRVPESMVMVKGKARDIDAVVKWMLVLQDAYDEDTRVAMRALLTKKYSPAQSDYDTEIFMKLPAERAGEFFGKGGARIRSTANKFYVRFETDKQEDGSFLLKIIGSLGDVQAAHRYIQLDSSMLGGHRT